MNKQQTQEWLKKLEALFEFSIDFENQPRQNEYGYGWDENEREISSIKDISEFISQCYEIVSRKIDRPATFYAWADEQSGHCCFSVISGHQFELPFQIKIVHSSLEEVSQRVLAMDGATYGDHLKVWVQWLGGHRQGP